MPKRQWCSSNSVLSISVTPSIVSTAFEKPAKWKSGSETHISTMLRQAVVVRQGCLSSTAASMILDPHT
jgi:hypothetical protein